jgi:hypothetical protein
LCPGFRLDRADAAELKKQVEAISQEHVLVISSKFRTDLIYYDVDDHVDEILRIWCNICGVSYKDSTKQKFFRSKNELLTLTHYFYRLQLLYRMPQWHKVYYEELLSMWIENPKEPVLGTLNKVMILLNESSNNHTLKLDSMASVPMRIWPPRMGSAIFITRLPSASDRGGIASAGGTSLKREILPIKSVLNTFR